MSDVEKWTQRFQRCDGNMLVLTTEECREIGATMAALRADLRREKLKAEGNTRAYLQAGLRHEAEISTLRADLARVTEERDALTAALAAERERWEKALAVVDQHVARGERVEYQREGAFGGRVVTTSRRGDLCDMRDALRRLVALMPTPTTEARDA